MKWNEMDCTKAEQGQNLLVQLTGTKEISLLKPSEESKLQYQDMLDVQHGIGAVINGCIIGYVIHVYDIMCIDIQLVLV